MLNEVSVVICTRDCLNLVEANLPAIRKTMEGAEIIIIDGNSTDGTKEFSEKYADIMLSDGGKGLSYARQYGVEQATRPFVLFMGTDNRMPVETIQAMVAAFHADIKVAGVGVKTKVIDANTYWIKVMELFFKYLINRHGPADVVGTPSMYRRQALLKVQFDSKIKACDDTDLAYRLQKEGYTLEIIDAYAEEKNPMDFAEFVHRWNGYGRSDAEFYATHHKSWGVMRKLKSFTHPLRKYGIRGAWLFLIHGDILYIPGLWYATFLRYRGWIRSARKGYFGR